MGKKRNIAADEPPEYATESEKKKTRSANYSQLSTETLLIKEQEATQDLVKVQTELERMRTNIGIHYRSDPLRQMNTKRYRAEYALGEIKAEIQRRARRKQGQDMPKEGIHSGSMSGVIATTLCNTSHAKTRQDATQAASVLADSLKKEREAQEREKQEAEQLKRSFVASSSSSARASGNGETSFPFPCPPTSSAINNMAMMSAMGPSSQGDMNPAAMMQMMSAMGAGAPTPQEMAAAAMQFQAMQQAMKAASPAMSGMGGMGMGGMTMPKAFAAKAAPKPGMGANVPAGLLKKLQQKQQG